MKHLFISCILIVCLHYTGWSQQEMTIEDAISIAMEYNFDIQVANNSLIKAENNKSIYNSGYLPTLTANSGAQYSNNNSSLTNQNGEVSELNGIVNKSYNNNISLNYLLFNGGARKNNFKRLKQAYEFASTERKIQIENTLIDVYTSFFNVARNQEQKNTLLKAYTISKDRLERVTAQNKYGQKNKLAVLNAQIDTNNDSISLLNVAVLLKNSQRDLNLLLGRAPNTNATVSKQVSLDNLLSYDELLNLLQKNNNLLKQVEINKKISKLTIKINIRQRLDF